MNQMPTRINPFLARILQVFSGVSFNDRERQRHG